MLTGQFASCFGIAVVILITFAVWTVIAKKHRGTIAAAGIIIALVFMFLPAGHGTDPAGYVTDVLASIFYAVRVLTANEDYELDRFDALPDNLRGIYILVLSSLYVIAPLLTAGVIISFIYSKFEKLRLFMTGHKIYMFSCRNERSEAIAKDISGKEQGAVFMFFRTEGSDDQELDGKVYYFASEGSITDADSHILAKKKVEIYLTDDDSNVNISDALSLIKLTNELKNASDIYINLFTSEPAHEILLNSVRKDHVRLRRINENSVLAYSLLINDRDLQERFFMCMRGEKINIALVGFGGLNEELFKAFLWYFQYKCEKNVKLADIKIYADDRAAETVRRKYSHMLSGSCASAVFNVSLLDEKSFICENDALIFADSGDSMADIERALDISKQFWRNNYNADPKNLPGKFVIKVPVKQISLDSAGELTPKNFKGSEYPIRLIPYNSVYTANGIVIPEVEKIAEDMYGGYGASGGSKSGRNLYDYDFDYRSNLSSAIFWYVILKNDAYMADVRENKDESPEKAAIKEIYTFLEHKRWNGFMLSEGYEYNGSESGFQHSAKLHKCLCAWTIEEWRKFDDKNRKFDENNIRIALMNIMEEKKQQSVTAADDS